MEELKQLIKTFTEQFDTRMDDHDTIIEMRAQHAAMLQLITSMKADLQVITSDHEKRIRFLERCLFQIGGGAAVVYIAWTLLNTYLSAAH